MWLVMIGSVSCRGVLPFALNVVLISGLLKQKKTSVVSVRKRNISTERPPLLGEVSANFSG
jgi:hypothetical protein